MAVKQNYGIAYPFSSDNLDEVYVDLNKNHTDSIKSQVLHVIFTPKGQRLRHPDFGSDLVKFIFDPSDSSTLDGIKSTIRSDISTQIPDVEFKDLSIIDIPEDDHHKIVNVIYNVKQGNYIEENNVAVMI